MEKTRNDQIERAASDRGLDADGGTRTRLLRFIKGHAHICVLVALILIGGALRAVESFWGYPYRLHPDEPVIVNAVVDLLKRHSFETNAFAWPAQFVIKLNMLVCQAFSYLKYHASGAVTVDAHLIDFYIVCRLCNAFFGMLMIPMAYLTAGKISPKTAGGGYKENPADRGQSDDILPASD